VAQEIDVARQGSRGGRWNSSRARLLDEQFGSGVLWDRLGVGIWVLARKERGRGAGNPGGGVRRWVLRGAVLHTWQGWRGT
jgi:hypothetical protein